MKAAMKNLEDILKGVQTGEWTGPRQQIVENLQTDSREVTTQSLFVAIRGIQADGHTFIDKAIENGAIAVIAEVLPENRAEGVAYIQVSETRTALGLLAGNFYDHPSRQLMLVGVTGTNGKTTTATLLYRLFRNLGHACGLISTVENRIGGEVLPSRYTTPDVVTLNSLLRKMVDAGCSHAFMEVSSHALDQERVAGISFSGGVFTNISHDHLDYHKTFRNYIFAKKKLFDLLPETAFALVNKDDRRWEVMLQNTRAGKKTFALHGIADFRGRVMENDLHGLVMQIEGQSLSSRLIGTFNASNLLAAYAVAVLLEQSPDAVLTALSEVESAEGRFQQISGPEPNVIGVVDYAHTPDALEKVLQTLRQINTGGWPVFTVVGCGGDRDRGKRPEMARIACQYSDQVILTSDNPRSENPQDIIDEMLAGVSPDSVGRVLAITDRKQAIRTAVRLAGTEGLVLVAGKGHETTQEIQGERFLFDDREVLREAFQELCQSQTRSLG